MVARLQGLHRLDGATGGFRSAGASAGCSRRRPVEREDGRHDDERGESGRAQQQWLSAGCDRLRPACDRARTAAGRSTSSSWVRVGAVYGGMAADPSVNTYHLLLRPRHRIAFRALVTIAALLIGLAAGAFGALLLLRPALLDRAGVPQQTQRGG